MVEFTGSDVLCADFLGNDLEGRTHLLLVFGAFPTTVRGSAVFARGLAPFFLGIGADVAFSENTPEGERDACSGVD